MPRKSIVPILINSKDINSPVNQSDQSELDTNIQADKNIKQDPIQIVQPIVELPKKPKKIMNEVQLANLKRGRQNSMAKKAIRDKAINEEKAAMKARLDELERQLKEQKDLEFENKFIKKAVAIKERQLKREKVLQLIKDDPETNELVNDVVQKQKPQPKKVQQEIQQPIQQIQQKPKYIFV